MDDRLRALLADAVGPAAIDGATGAVTPADASGVAAAVAACAHVVTAVRVVFVAPRAPVPPESVTLCLARLSDVTVDEASGTAQAGAGAAVRAMRSELDRAGLAVASPIGNGTRGGEHVGELVANGGLARRAVTGIEAVLASGELVVSGGRMLKDVAGYDLPALLLGSGGRLAIVTEVTLRLVPKGAMLPAHEPPGPVRPGRLDARIRRALDPRGLLSPAG